MSGKGVAGRGRARGRGGRGMIPPKIKQEKFVGKIDEIKEDTFDYGDSKFAAQFNKSLKNIANYLERELGLLVGQSVRELDLAEVLFPPAPDPGASPAEFFLWQEAYKTAGKKRTKLEDDVKKAYAVVYDQCSPKLKTRLEGTATFEQVNTDRDVVELLGLIRGIVCQFDDQRQGVFALVQAKKMVMTFSQDPTMSNNDYSEQFKALVDVVESYGGSYGNEEGLIKAELQAAGVNDPDTATADQLKTAIATSREKFLACMFISAADHGRYRKLKEDLQNAYTLGTDNYPTTLEGAIRLLNNYRTGPRFIRMEAPREEVVFAQKAPPTATTTGGDGAEDNKKIPGIRNRAGDVVCYGCGAVNDHLIKDCPKGDAEHQVHAVYYEQEEDDDYSFHQRAIKKGMGPRIDPNWLLLDSQSTTNIMMNGHYLTDIQTVSTPIRVHCNAGVTETDKRARFGGLNVWYNPKGIANIISLAYLRKHGYDVKYDSKREPCFEVSKPGERGKIKFIESPEGLHYYDLSKADDDAVLLVSTIRQNFEGYTKREVEAAKDARRALGMVGNPSERDFRGMGEDSQT